MSTIQVTVTALVRAHRSESARKNHSEATKRYCESLTDKERESKNQLLRDVWSEPENREKILALSKIGLRAAMSEKGRESRRKTDKTPETKEKRSRAAIRRLANMPKVSSLSTVFKEALNNAGLFPEVEYPIEFYQVDFCFPNRKVVVEVDGDYWHCNPEIYSTPKNDQQKRVVDKDRRERTYLTNRGWNLLRFWEKDLNKDISSCINKVLEVLNGQP